MLYHTRSAKKDNNGTGLETINYPTGSSGVAAGFEANNFIQRAEPYPCGNKEYQPYYTQPGMVNNAKRNDDHAQYYSDDAVGVSHVFVHRFSFKFFSLTSFT
jgi:hypothetical protein